jgi:hypothetical protein
MDKKLEWCAGREQVAANLLLEGGRMIVSPTKVGYRFTVKAEASGLVN